MSATNIDPEKVIARLSQQLGHLHAEIAMRDVALEAAHARLAELEGDQAPSANTDAPTI